MRRAGPSLRAALLVAAILATTTAVATVHVTPAGATACVSHLLHPANVAQPTSIVTGPDGNLWFTSSANHRIGRVDPDTLEVITYSGAGVEPVGIVSGPDGNVWFTAFLSGQIGRITPAGVITLFPDAPKANGNLLNPQGITVGPDGNLWFTSFDVNGSSRIGKINPTTEAIATFPSETAAHAPIPGALDITTGPDGNLWYSAAGTFPDFVGRVVRFTPPTGPANPIVTAGPGVPLTVPGGIAAGPDGNLWVTSLFNNQVLRVTPGGAVTPFTAPDVIFPQRIAPGRPGEDELWFAPDNFPGRVGRITTAGAITTYSASGNEGATDVETGPDGNVWFVGQYDDTVGYVDPDDPGPRFSDLTSTHPFCQEIGWMDEQGISTGYSDRTFRPADAVTRQSMSAFLYRLAGEPAFTPPVAPSFSDVSAAHPFFHQIEWMSAEGITGGYADHTYRPSAAVTRQSMSAFMQRLADPDLSFVPPGAATFDDVSPSHPFFAEIEWMAAEDISTGYPDGTFKPSAVVTRQAMSAFMFRLAPLLAP